MGGYSPRIGLREMVAHVMIAHEERLARSRVVHRLVDEDGDGSISRSEMKTFLTELLHVPESTPADFRNALSEELVERAFEDVGCSHDGLISYPTFHQWTKRNSLCDFVNNFMEEKQV